MAILNPRVSRFTFSHHVDKRVSRSAALRCVLGGAALGCVLAATPALAAESWTACDGTVVTTTTKDGKADTSSAPAHDVYVLNDAGKSLFKYSETRKTTDPVFVTTYDDKAVAWSNGGGAGTGANAAAWEGRIDRAAMALKLTRTEHGESMVWTEQCKPTAAK